MKNRNDLIATIKRRAKKMEPVDGSLLEDIAEILARGQWNLALMKARKMDTMVREEIPAWGWRMMEKVVAAKAYLEQVLAQPDS
jgi:hypothetical protein